MELGDISGQAGGTPILVVPTAVLPLLEGALSPLPPESMLQQARYALYHTFTVSGRGPAIHHAIQCTCHAMLWRGHVMPCFGGAETP